MKEVSARGTSLEFPSSGHQVIKIIGNLCFFIFVASVIVFSVIAATYQPPDPWFQTSKAITKSLSATLPNSTIAIDNSLLHTGEDLVTSPPSAVNAGEALLNNNYFPTSLACDPNAPLNCSNTVLAAIQLITSKIFRKSIIFISYDTPSMDPIPTNATPPGASATVWRNHGDAIATTAASTLLRLRIAPSMSFVLVSSAPLPTSPAIPVALPPHQPLKSRI
ncbi:hypothetical protein MA16_Dca003505 [Dendrobium catenatum]|uniref:Uncharacterized protein n=1 Tax=Dendrobium catenatum TaxID=906689 RepID=A0A2I0WF94_9ASPA|nr:hypothetical protein MA16_Dca003505 [Dendrobium catenatum]